MSYSAEIPSKFRTRVSTPKRSWVVLLREAYAEADPRALALFRVALGLVVSITALGRWGDASEHLSDEGWLPRAAAFAGATPLSLLRYLGEPGAVKLFLAAGAVVASCLSAGLWTK